MKRFKYIYMCLILVLITVSCTEQGTERGILLQEETTEDKIKVELSIFYSGENTSWVAVVEELCNDFMQENPDVLMNMEHSKSDNYTEELKIKNAMGEFPDIFEMESTYTFKEAEKLCALSPELGKLVDNPVTINGEVYALPYYSTSYGIIYNQVLFKKYNLSIPQTYDEFINVCRVFMENGITPLAVGGSDKSVESGWINYFFLTEVEANIPEWQKKKQTGEVSFQDADFKAALQDFQELMTGDFILEGSINMGDNQVITSMIDQEAAMHYATPSFINKVISIYPESIESDKTPLEHELVNDTVQLRLGWFYMPDRKGKSIVIDKVGGQWAISGDMSEEPYKKEAAEEFLKFCFEKNNYRKILQAMHVVPTAKESVLYAAPAVQQKVLKDYRYAEKNKNFLGNRDTPENFRKDMEKILRAVATNTMSIDMAAKQMDISWDETVGNQVE